MRSSPPRSASATFSLSVRRAPAGPVRSPGGTQLVSGNARRTRADDVALSRADAALRRRAACLTRRRVHATLSCEVARIGVGTGSLVRQGRIAQSDQFVQGAWPVSGDYAG